MIAGACQADVGVLVISARKGEFETGFEPHPSMGPPPPYGDVAIA